MDSANKKSVQVKFNEQINCVNIYHHPLKQAHTSKVQNQPHHAASIKWHEQSMRKKRINSSEEDDKDLMANRALNSASY